jgi:hypothetical protein
MFNTVLILTNIGPAPTKAALRIGANFPLDQGQPEQFRLRCFQTTSDAGAQGNIFINSGQKALAPCQYLKKRISLNLEDSFPLEARHFP